MSNKLIKENDQERKKEKIQKIRKLCAASLVVAITLFLLTWTNVALTSFRFRKQMEQMVLGKDYFVEEIVITKKDAERYSGGKHSSSTNYYFYYGTDETKRMQVSGKLYEEYEAGDSILAYTTDHIYYDYEKSGILPREEFRNNELMKAAGAFWGCIIVILAICLFVDRI